MSGATYEDQTVEDGEIMHSPADLHHHNPPSARRPLQDVMDFSLSEDEEAGGVREDGTDEDDEDNLDSLVIKPPQAKMALGPQGSHQSTHRGNRESRRHQRDVQRASDRHTGSGGRYDKHRVLTNEPGGTRKHRDHKERKKHKHYDRDKERAYSKQMIYPVEHQQHQSQINYNIEMASHHNQLQGQVLGLPASSRGKEGDRFSGPHNRSSSSGNTNRHESGDGSHYSSNSGISSNKRGGSGNSGSRRSGNSGRNDHVATVTVSSQPMSGTEDASGDEKQQQADRTLRDLRDRLLSKRVVSSGKVEGERGNSNRKRGKSDPCGAVIVVASDALEGEAGQLVKEIIDISTSVVQQAVAGEQQLTEEEQAEKEVRRKRLLVAEREMIRQKEQLRQERQERLERMERQRRYQQLQQQEERHHGRLVHDDSLDDVIVVTVSSENSNSDLDDDNDSNVDRDDGERRRDSEIDDDMEERGRGDSSDSGENREEDEEEDENEEDDEQVVKSKDRERDRTRERERKHGRRRHGKLKDDRGRRDKDRGRRRHDTSTDEGEENTKDRNDAVTEDASPDVLSAAVSGAGSCNSRDKDRFGGRGGGHRDSRVRRSHSPRLSRSPRSLHNSTHSQSRSPLSRSRSRSRSPNRTNSRHILLRSSRSRSRSRSPHRKSKTPPAASSNASNNKEPAATDKDGSSSNSAKKDNTDSIIHIDETLPPYYPAIQGCRPVEEFRCLNRIEEGTYGVVYRAQDKRTREIVALKKLKMEKEKEGFPITSLREINTLLKGQHPNIVTVREIVVGSHMDKIFIVMDYVEHDLKSLMETMRSRRQAFSAGEVKCLLRQLLMAVAHLHDNWILHRDLKTSNLLLSHRGVLKVGDFGLAREYGSPLRPYTPIVVTLWYRAPELLLCTKEYSTPVDVWSVGCIMGELVLMNALFPGKSEVEQLTKIFKELGTPNETIWPDYPNLPAVKKLHFTTYPVNSLHTRFPQLTALGCGLLQAFLTYDPKQRITAEAALQHDYFTEAPLAIDPAMFPTWPAKSELGVGVNRTRAASPKPPSGGREYKQLGADADDPGFGFRIGISMADSRRLAAAAANAGAGSGGSGAASGASGIPGGFSLKF